MIYTMTGIANQLNRFEILGDGQWKQLEQYFGDKARFLTVSYLPNVESTLTGLASSEDTATIYVQQSVATQILNGMLFLTQESKNV